MKFKRIFITNLFCLIFLLATSLFVRYHNNKRPLLSPIPDVGKIIAAWSQDKKPIWSPEDRLSNLATAQVDVLAKSALVVDLNSNQTLYAKEANQVLPIASLTKIMTALVALESAPLNSKMVVSHQATQVGEATMNLKTKEKLTLEELLYGLMLVSGNDAATVIAENITGRTALFVHLMNEKTNQLGLNNTRFYNPHGLDEKHTPPNQSTAYELAILSYYALDKFPSLGKIAATDSIAIEANSDHQRHYLINNLGLERTYPGLFGLKPGYTDSAGYCLVGLAKKEQKAVLVVLLNSPSLKTDLVALLDYWLR
ncbi:MAG: D-alanyl-D-alanine carboxypeptidase [Candidatus Shapirobacteria bacterium]|nr:D-alanyl-D-alanine carboxypeptidase [Candidatus Shapirobacteria bacterium]